MSHDADYVLRLRAETQERMEEYRQTQINQRMGLWILAVLLALACVVIGFAVAALNFQ